MIAGRLDRKVQVLRSAKSDDGLGEAETWAPHGLPTWASKVDVSDGEQWRAAQVGARVTTRFQLRWSRFAADIHPGDRLTCEGVAYEITGRKEVGRRQGVELTAVASLDPAQDPGAALVEGDG